MKTMRAFIAVNLSVEAVRMAAAAAVGLKKRLDAAGVRAAWVPAPNLHLTVRFLGWVREDAVVALRDGLAAIGTRHQPFSLLARGLAALPGPGRPRVLYVAIEDVSGALARLNADVEAMCRDLGFAPETRPFHAHLTLARMKEGPAGEIVPALIAESGSLDLGTSKVREVVLYESAVSSGQGRGAREYLAHVRAPLGVKLPAAESGLPVGQTRAESDSLRHSAGGARDAAQGDDDGK